MFPVIVEALTSDAQIATRGDEALDTIVESDAFPSLQALNLGQQERYATEFTSSQEAVARAQ